MKAVLEANRIGFHEVMIVFSDRVLRANRSIKVSEAKFLAFDSPAYPHLASITATGVSFAPQLVVESAGAMTINPHFQRGILSVEIVPGLEPGLLMEVLQSGKCQGLLLKSLGSGSVPSEDEYSLLPVIKAATETYHVPVLVSTKFVGGNTHMEIYEPGKLALEAGAIPTGDMTDVMAQVKFMWALAQGHRTINELKQVIATSYVGEISI
jgi:L-asparaginase